MQDDGRQVQLANPPGRTSFALVGGFHCYEGNQLVGMILLCFIAPWLAMFLRGKIVQGILCIILHITLIGWIPATIWALVVTRESAPA